MGKEWISMSDELFEIAKRNKDFYAFAFDDPFFIIDKTDSEENLGIIDLTNRQRECIILAALDVLWNTNESILLVAEQGNRNSIFISLHQYCNLLGIEISRIVLSATSGKGIQKQRYHEYAMIIIDRIEKYVSHEAFRSKALKELSAKRVIATIHRKDLTTKRFELERKSRVFRACDTKSDFCLNASQIAIAILSNSRMSENMGEKLEVLKLSSKLLTNLVSNQPISALVKDESGNIDNMADKAWYILSGQRALTGRYVYSYGVDLYSNQAAIRGDPVKLGEAEIRRNLNEYFDKAKHMLYYLDKAENEDMLRIDDKEYNENYRKFLEAEA